MKLIQRKGLVTPLRDFWDIEQLIQGESIDIMLRLPKSFKETNLMYLIMN